MEITTLLYKTYRTTKNKHSLSALPPPPTVETYTIIILYLLRQRLIDEAVGVAERLRERVRLGFLDVGGGGGGEGSGLGADVDVEEVMRRLGDAVQRRREEEESQGWLFTHFLMGSGFC